MRHPKTLPPPMAETDRMTDTDQWVSSTVHKARYEDSARAHKAHRSRSRHPGLGDVRHVSRDTSQTLVVSGNRRKSTDIRLVPLTQPGARVASGMSSPPPPQRLTLPAVNQEMTRIHLVHSSPKLPVHSSRLPAEGVSSQDDEDVDDDETKPSIKPTASQSHRRNSVQSQDRDLPVFNPEEFFPPREIVDSPSRRKKNSLESTGSWRDGSPKATSSRRAELKEEKASSIDFTGNRIGQKGIDYLIEVLSRLHTVYQVVSRTFFMLYTYNRNSIDFNGKRISQKGIDYLIEVLSRLHTVYQVVSTTFFMFYTYNRNSIDFTGNRIGQKGIDYLIEVLSRLHTVYQVVSRTFFMLYTYNRNSIDFTGNRIGQKRVLLEVIRHSVY
ncbi:hypothetical protein ElyMa_004715600 [Elysia marginata]|uniref:Uncharacterized protein n=1 Tax=Elysia marginata TaxID=1093978 RepID=A0AAV4IAE0_9GAST|nr:hypothetical protein ElyMa_004715600 [Elysia marginata]